MALLVIPVVVRPTDEMLQLQPSTMREAALALGVPQWKLTLQIVLRAAKTGVVTAIIGPSGCGKSTMLRVFNRIALRPQVLLLDEPTSALDPISTGRIEQLITKLKAQYTVIIVAHNMQQAARVSDSTAFMFMSELIEHDKTDQIFTTPKMKQTEDYITGRFG